MPALTDVQTVVRRALEGRHLLDHPYYQRWQQGSLDMTDLALYAEQYRHFEQSLPGVLASAVESLPEGDARRAVEDNLRDELSSPRPHAELFESFAEAVG